MDPATSELWLNVIAGGAIVLWCGAAGFVARAARRLAEPQRGEAELPGMPADVTRSLAIALAGGVARPFAGRTGGAQMAAMGLTLDQVTDSSIAWHAGYGNRHEGSLEASATGEGTHVEWKITTRSGLVTAARWVSGISLLVIASLYWLLSTQVVPSQDAHVRGQVFQMLQAIHLLWPPFLLAGMARTMQRRLDAEIERVIKNQRFLAPATP